VNGGLDPAIEEFTAELNMKLGNLPVNPLAQSAKALKHNTHFETAPPAACCISTNLYQAISSTYRVCDFVNAT
jgi:hypothetical protein